MAYEKTNWVNGETPISAENLNKMEQGIEDASKSGGNVVDTFDVEDKTTNAPSVRAVEEKLVRNIVTCKPTEEYKNTSNAPTSVDVPLSIVNQVGNGFTIENGKIKIGNGINYIKVSGNMQAQSTSSGKTAGLQIYKKNSDGDKYFISSMFPCYTTSIYYCTAMGDIMVDVKEGDLIIFRPYLETNVTIKTDFTNITVEAVG